ncbi:MFS transporter [Burkholderia sp. S171]|uniref:MFS transporter n=1 Tax=Burkholderia sp. S171 TaxID=1641860 RepID=UPI00131CF19B|nr:MFS transporter [Burkholderia sp. S171]
MQNKIADDVKAKSSSAAWRIIIPASLGNALEWFDLVVYGFFAVTISKLFFPTGSDTVSLILTLGTFGVSFLMRPLGAIVLGVYADKAGRKAALMASITLMMTGTLVIALLPTYSSIGLWAPAGMVAARLVQGFSAGGEFGSATAFLAEHTPSRRYFYTSWQVASQGITTLLAAGFGATLNATLDTGQMNSWGWRVPFCFGLLIGPVALCIRRNIEETPDFRQNAHSENPLAEMLKNDRDRLCPAVGAVVLATVASYLLLYMPTYAIRQLGMAPSDAFAATLAAGITQFVIAPMAGHFANRRGCIRIMTCSSTLFLLLVYPLLAVLRDHPVFVVMLIVEIVFGALVAVYFGVLPGLLSNLFKTKNRTTGLSLAYSLAVTIFGGFAPLIITWLIKALDNSLAPAFYVMAAAVVSLLSIRVIKARTHLN